MKLETTFIDFFGELALNNSKSWFDENRDRYKSDVKQPWEALVAEIASELRGIVPIDDLPVGRFVSRINRDIRFSKNKSPYNTHVFAVFAEHGKKTAGPGFYLHIGIDGLHIAGGYHMPDKHHLTLLRRTIVHREDELIALLQANDFQRYWDGELRGEKNKILPAEFKEAARSNPFIAHKGWTYWREYPIDHIFTDDLVKFVIDHYKAALPVNQFLADAIVE